MFSHQRKDNIVNQIQKVDDPARLSFIPWPEEKTEILQPLQKEKSFRRGNCCEFVDFQEPSKNLGISSKKVEDHKWLEAKMFENCDTDFYQGAFADDVGADSSASLQKQYFAAFTQNSYFDVDVGDTNSAFLKSRFLHLNDDLMGKQSEFSAHVQDVGDSPLRLLRSKFESNKESKKYEYSDTFQVGTLGSGIDVGADCSAQLKAQHGALLSSDSDLNADAGAETRTVLESRFLKLQSVLMNQKDQKFAAPGSCDVGGLSASTLQCRWLCDIQSEGMIPTKSKEIGWASSIGAASSQQISQQWSESLCNPVENDKKWLSEIKKKIKMADAICFDVDSTVIQDEGINMLADFCGASDAVAELTRRAMGGNMPFEEALKARLDLIQPSQQTLSTFISTNPPNLTPGIRELVSLLHAQKVDVYLVSGGFRQMIQPVADIIGVSSSRIFANNLMFHADGSFKDFDRNEPTSKSGGKAEVMKRLKERNGYRTIVMVGDGVTDMEARPPASVFVGFGGVIKRKAVVEGADWFISNFDEFLQLFTTDGA